MASLTLKNIKKVYPLNGDDAKKQEKLAANNTQPQDIVLGVRPEHIELGTTGTPVLSMFPK